MANVKPLILKSDGNKSELGVNDILTLPISGSSPSSNPPAGSLYLYALSDGFYEKNSSGAITKISNVSGGVIPISGTAVIDFGIEKDITVLTVSNGILTNANIKGFSFIPTETTETSIDDFSLNGVSFTISNIIDNTSFDIIGTAVNDASGNYTIKYLIIT